MMDASNDNVTNNPDDVPFTVTVDNDDLTAPLTYVIKDGNEVILTATVTQVQIDASNGVFTENLTLTEGTHLLSVEVTDTAGNRSHQSEELVVEIDRTAPAVAAAPDLLSVADTGFSDIDNVTRLNALALGGAGVEPNSKVRVFSGTELIGQGVATSEGNWEITTEPLDDGTHSLTVVLEDLAGNVNAASAALEVVIDSAVPNTPYLDLLNDDGFSDTDDVTGTGLLQFEMIGNDTRDGQDNPIPNDIEYRLYWRNGDPGVPGSGTGEVLVYDSLLEFAGLTTLGQLIRTVSQDVNDPAGTPFPDGVHNFKLEVEDRAGNISPDFLLTVEIDSVDPTIDIDILASSDSGMFDNDNVTNIQQIAFQGRGEVNGDVTLFAQKVDATGTPFGEILIIGSGEVGSDATDVEAGVPGATPDDDLGMWEITAEPLADGVYDVYAFIEDEGGNTARSDTLRLEVDTIDPNTAFLDVVEASDSGRNNDDNVTNDNTPTITMTSHDTNLDLHQVLFQDNFKFRIYDRLENSAEFLLYDSAVDAAEDANTDAVTLLEQMFTANLFITETLAAQFVALNPGGNFAVNAAGELVDGIHNLKLEVEDRAGNISDDFLLDVLIDTVAPPVTIDGAINSDSGDTLSDQITNNSRPEFFGTAEANSIVNLFVAGMRIDASLTVADPLDGDDAFPEGAWRTQFLVDLNDETAFATLDGLRTISVVAEDLAGNRNEIDDLIGDADQQLDIFLDTQGPRITNVFPTDNPAFDIFQLKPNNVDQGPTPGIDSLTISVSDLPGRLAEFDFAALSEVLNNSAISLRGDHSGLIAIRSITFTDTTALPTQPEAGSIVLTFDDFLPDDRFTLTIGDSLTDPAGNALDGEINAGGPIGTPSFPSGDGVPGGDFVARFTVDSRPEVGSWSQGLVYVDINGNQVWDPEGQDNDATNRDFVYQFGRISDGLFAGNFHDAGADGSGFDKLGAYGLFDGTYSFLIDTDDDGVGDVTHISPFQVNGAPVAGNFDGNAANGDEIGLFDGNNWYLDTTGDNQLDTTIAASYNGIPLVGDFTGEGDDDLAVYVNDTNTVIFDTNRDGTADSQKVLGDNENGDRFSGLSGFTDKPVAGDLNLDGVDDIGIWVKGRQGVLPEEQGEFFFWVSDDDTAVASDNFDSYSPSPLGNDLYTPWGDEFALPIFGNFDPPVSSETDNSNDSGTNPNNNYDVNNDGSVTALDALIVINAINEGITEAEATALSSSGESLGDRFIDVNGDSSVTAIDALQVINELNRISSSSEPIAVGSDSGQYDVPWSAAVDSVFDNGDDDEDDDFFGLTF